MFFINFVLRGYLNFDKNQNFGIYCAHFLYEKNDFQNQKVRMELEERKKRQSRMLVSAIQEGMIKKVKEKDEEIQRMGKINWFLQEKAKSLYVENQIWRDLAQANEATANSLRSNLEQVLAHASGGAATLADDAESSCCGSSDHGRCTLAGGEEGAVKDKMVVVKDNLNHNRMCKKCGERESSVLLLPCRHLCLCTLCGSNLIGSCPVCDSVMTASVHVNMSWWLIVVTLGKNMKIIQKEEKHYM